MAAAVAKAVHAGVPLWLRTGPSVPSRRWSTTAGSAATSWDSSLRGTTVTAPPLSAPVKSARAQASGAVCEPVHTEWHGFPSSFASGGGAGPTCAASTGRSGSAGGGGLATRSAGGFLAAARLLEATSAAGPGEASGADVDRRSHAVATTARQSVVARMRKGVPSILSRGDPERTAPSGRVAACRPRAMLGTHGHRRAHPGRRQPLHGRARVRGPPREPGHRRRDARPRPRGRPRLAIQPHERPHRAVRAGGPGAREERRRHHARHHADDGQAPVAGPG